VYKFLIVGCGGSGGAALAYMMDQLRSELAQFGIDDIPPGWQFVHIDVPTSPDTEIPGIGNVALQGGRYLSTAPSSGSYTVLDNALSQWLQQGKALGEFGTWAPRHPEGITVPISYGAGQMRAVGRAITLARAKTLVPELSAVYQRLTTVETNSAMAEVARRMPGAGSFSPNDAPIVLVVSSMAGGAGASMALDVCRLLAQIQGVNPDLVGVFMVAPDAFDQLPASARGGVTANGLAMLGEIVASQTNAAEEHDLRVLRALGLDVSAKGRAPFKRVFPVGRFVGAERTLFGDGSQDAVYRGLGRGLAALVSSGPASRQFVAYDLGNVSDDTPAQPDRFGWGTASGSDTLPWGAFGFASLSMGRDRYRHYAAQRLARFTVDRLREGHLQPGNPASGIDQLRALADSQWQHLARQAGLPVADVPGAALSMQSVASWFTQYAFPRVEAQGAGRRILDEQFTPFIPSPAGTMQQWLPVLQRFLADRRGALQGAIAHASYTWGFSWAQRLHDAVLREVLQGARLFGLPYAREALDRIERVVRDELAARLGDLAQYQAGDLGQLDPHVGNDFAAMKGTIANPQAVVDRLVGSHLDIVTTALYARSSDFAREILRSFVGEVIAPLREAITESLAVLDASAAAQPTASGLANVATAQYALWPSEHDHRVPERFGVADNEILITPAETFGAQYERDLRSAVDANGAPPLADARVHAAGFVVGGDWPVASGRPAPGPAIEVVSRWRSGLFTTDPVSHSPLTPARGAYRLRLTPADLVGRADQFVARPGESFERFCSLSLRDYALGTGASEAVRPELRADLVSKFGETLVRALPLISLDADAVNAIHGSSPQYRYKFSAVPFKDIPDVVEGLTRGLEARENIAPEAHKALVDAISEEPQVTRIDVFGSYRNYSPLVFDALLRPAQRQWASVPPQGKLAFWAHRRSRPLPAALPMSDVERRAMIAGWYVGQLTGQIRLPDAPYTDPVRVWDDEDRRWLDFPHPLLTPPSEFIGRQIDWLPAVLESYLIAIARGLESPVLHTLRPYRALRRLYDRTPLKPRSGLEPLSAEETLADWLETGTTPSGQASRVTGDSVQERAEGARTFLTQVLDFTRANFLETEDSSQTSGPYGDISSRERAAATPIFRDLARDIVAVLGDLDGVLTNAERLAVEGRSSRRPGAVPGAAPGGGDVVPDVPMPDFGAF